MANSPNVFVPETNSTTMMSLTKTKLLILKELSEQPLHGYLLGDRLGKHESTIYPHLKELEERELLVVESFEDKKVYETTTRGDLIVEGFFGES